MHTPAESHADRTVLAGNGTFIGAPYVLFILIVIAMLNQIDRKIVVILQEGIKHDLNLSDTQLGSLTGLAFAVVYCLAAFPIARMADRTSRRGILTTGVSVWSALTAAAGFATSYGALIACRMGVAAGEASATSSSHSLISDYYPPEKRIKPFALWAMAVPIGTTLAYFLGGLLGDALGWRMALIVVGVAGLVLAPFIMLMREPQRGRYDAVKHEVVPPGTVVALLWQTKALRYLLIATACQALVLNVVFAWSAPFYSRVFGLPLDQIGFFLSVVIGVAGVSGVAISGAVAARLSARDARWSMWLPAAAAILCIPLIASQFLVNHVYLSLGLGFAGGIVLNIYLPCAVATAQSLVAPGMRAVSSASMQFGTSAFGLGLGPVLIGFVSDQLTRNYGLETSSLRYSVLFSLPFAILAGIIYWRAAVHLRHDLAKIATNVAR